MDKFVPELQHVPLIVINGRDKGVVNEKFHQKDFPKLVMDEVMKNG